MGVNIPRPHVIQQFVTGVAGLISKDSAVDHNWDTSRLACLDGAVDGSPSRAREVRRFNPDNKLRVLSDLFGGFYRVHILYIVFDLRAQHSAADDVKKG